MSSVKTKCPFCDANQSVLEQSTALPLPCKKCGQTFVPDDVHQASNLSRLPDGAVLDVDEYEIIDDESMFLLDSDWIADASCISSGIRRVANSYFSLIVTVVALGTIAIANEFRPKLVQSPVVLMMMVAGFIVFLISLLLWFNGQVQLRKGHPVGSGLHEAIARSLNMSVMAIVARVLAKMLSLPLLKGIGGILSMAAFDRMLLYFELLCIELDNEPLRQRVQSLSKFYRRSFSVCIGFMLLYVLVAVPAGAPLMGLYVGLAVFGLSMIFFSIWFGAVLQAVRQAVEIRLN